MLYDPAKRALVTHAARHAFAIEPFQKWHHDSPRTLQCLTQFAYRGRSVFGNEISDGIFHAFKVLAQQHRLRGDFNHFAALDQKLKDSLGFRIALELSA